MHNPVHINQKFKELNSLALRCRPNYQKNYCSLTDHEKEEYKNHVKKEKQWKILSIILDIDLKEFNEENKVIQEFNELLNSDKDFAYQTLSYVIHTNHRKLFNILFNSLEKNRESYKNPIEERKNDTIMCAILNIYLKEAGGRNKVIQEFKKLLSSNKNFAYQILDCSGGRNALLFSTLLDSLSKENKESYMKIISKTAKQKLNNLIKLDASTSDNDKSYQEHCHQSQDVQAGYGHQLHDVQYPEHSYQSQSSQSQDVQPGYGHQLHGVQYPEYSYQSHSAQAQMPFIEQQYGVVSTHVLPGNLEEISIDQQSAKRARL
ncbi:hypothetical protein [Wolbachia endosymbiont of Pentidionis agamae]|uniref:hypothetical protein n=1 Tax=Wolbachia endosymbiont of Pentidionis agamae TaxID=3110435 RepID=UPI002FD1550B